MGRHKLDWAAIKQRYVTSGAGLREVAREYGVGMTAMREHSVSEGWVEAREEYRHARATQATQMATQKQLETDTRIYDITNMLLARIEELAEDVKPGYIRNITGALKDIREIRGEKSRLDIEEQEARIAKLRHDLEADKPSTQKIEIVGLPEGMDV